jgi:hypothetical protein
MVAACMVAAPLIKPETAAATIRDFIECFIFVIPPFSQTGTRTRFRPVRPGCAAFDSPARIRLQHLRNTFVEHASFLFSCQKQESKAHSRSLRSRKRTSNALGLTLAHAVRIIEIDPLRS